MVADDILPSRAPRRFWQKWYGGVIFLRLALAYGLYCIATRDANWFTRLGSVHFQGRNACAFGIVLLSLGLFWHFRYFWGRCRRLEQYSAAGQIAALILLVLSLVILLLRVGVFG